MKNEYGRSMIEMLGVLAIIGVLSIGGLAGYTMAMNRHRANTVLDYATKCGVMVQTQGQGTEAVGTIACNTNTYMGANTLPNTVASINAARAQNGHTNVEIVFAAADANGGVSSALANRVGLAAPAATYCFDIDEGVAANAWTAAACANPAVGNP